MNRRALWLGALRQGSVWRRAVKMGLTVGLLQAGINQGDSWWRGEVRVAVVAKTILSPLVTFTLVLFTGAAAWVDEHRGGEDGS
jgi:hypothetical protein